jgi:hypothetical protein
MLCHGSLRWYSLAALCSGNLTKACQAGTVLWLYQVQHTFKETKKTQYDPKHLMQAPYMLRLEGVV